MPALESASSLPTQRFFVTRGMVEIFSEPMEHDGHHHLFA